MNAVMAADEKKELKDDGRGGGLRGDTTTQKGRRMTVMKTMAKRVLQPTKNVYQLSSSYPFP